MSVPTEPRIVTPQEAQVELRTHTVKSRPTYIEQLLTTIATEHVRRNEYARASVVKALRWAAHVADPKAIHNRADAYEFGMTDV